MYDAPRLIVPSAHTVPSNSYYSVNSQRYRAPEWELVDWQNSVVVFGCSQVFGIGLEDNETLSSVLSQIIELPVINLGVQGSSISFAMYNNMLLHKNFPKPRAVVNMWTLPDRYPFFKQDGSVENIGGWNMRDLLIFHAPNAFAHATLQMMVTKQLWKDECPYIESTFFFPTNELLNIELPMLPIDNAKDKMHYGPKTMLVFASKIAKQLQQQGV